MKPHTDKTIILWGPDGLLPWYVNQLLCEREGWQVIRLEEEDNPACLIEAVEKSHPNVVIIYHEHEHCIAPLHQSLHSEFPNLRVVIIDPENNYLEVCNHQRIWVNEISDFLRILES